MTAIAVVHTQLLRVSEANEVLISITDLRPDESSLFYLIFALAFFFVETRQEELQRTGIYAEKSFRNLI